MLMNPIDHVDPLSFHSGVSSSYEVGRSSQPHSALSTPQLQGVAERDHHPFSPRPLPSLFHPSVPQEYSDIPDPYGQGQSSPTYYITTDVDLDEAKRPRACESCRQLKVRCDQDNPSQPCVRCNKAKRQCVVTQPSRKRQKKTDNRVADLEKKVDALTAALHKAQNANITSPPSTAHQSPEFTLSTDSGPLNVLTQRPGINSAPPALSHAHYRNVSDPFRISISDSSGMLSALMKRKRSLELPTPLSDTRTPFEPDDLDLATIDLSTISKRISDIVDDDLASKIFRRYTTEMARYLPVVVLDRNTTATEVRQSRPVLFLAIVFVAAVGILDTKAQERLHKLLLRVFADMIIFSGTKTFELLQALSIAANWYKPAPNFGNNNVFLFNLLSPLLALDFGLGRRIDEVQQRRTAILLNQRPGSYLTSESTEARRLWIGCYFAASHICLSLRQPNLIRWSPYLEECITALQYSANALDSDQSLCEHTKLMHICEKAGDKFSMYDPAAKISIKDRKTQEEVRNLESDLDAWSKSVPQHVWSPALRFWKFAANLYIHEIALHVDHNIADFKAPYTKQSLRSASSLKYMNSNAHASALRECLNSAQGMLEAFRKFDREMLRAMPMQYFVRTVYALMVVIVMHIAVTTKDSGLSKVYTKEELDTENHIQQTQNILRSLSEEDAFRPANVFIRVIRILGEGFHAKSSGETAKGGPRYGRPAPSQVQFRADSAPPPFSASMASLSAPADATLRYVGDTATPSSTMMDQSQPLFHSAFTPSFGEALSAGATYPPLPVMEDAYMGSPADFPMIPATDPEAWTRMFASDAMFGFVPDSFIFSRNSIPPIPTPLPSGHTPEKPWHSNG